MIETAYAAPEYDDEAIRFLEALWGEGFLSPGGPEEVDRILDGVRISDKNVLDIGCGTGGITMYMAKKYGTRYMTGFDVEQPVIEVARLRAYKQGLSDRVSFIHAGPRNLPFPDRSFDVVFSKDALVHVSVKNELFGDIFRLLKPGGVFTASDLMVSHDGEQSQDMKDYHAAEGLSYAMASPARYVDAMRRAGFERIETRDRNPWYREMLRSELASLKGPIYDKVAAAVGAAYVDRSIRIWEAMLKVLDSGDLRPTHLRGWRPAPENQARNSDQTR